MKKVCVVMVGYLKDYPPVLSMLQALNHSGYDVTVLAAGNNSNIEEYPGYDFAGVKAIDVIGEYEGNISIFSKFQRLLKIRKRLWKQIENLLLQDSLFIVVSEVTVKHLGERIIELNYLLYQLELIEGYYTIPGKNILKLDAKKIGNAAKGVIVCEYNRAHITKTWWQLDRIPYILKNKPYIPELDLNNLPKDVQKTVDSIKERVNGRKVVLYQGVVSKQRPVEKFVDAFAGRSSEYVTIVMSNNEPEFSNNVKPENYIYVPFIAPPYHLAVTSIAHLGIMIYVPGGKSSYSPLNPVYCAPNKIWEYSMFGVPMIANDNPGLKNEFEQFRIGECIKDISTVEIQKAAQKIECSYHEYQENTLNYYSGYNTKKEIQSILADCI